MEPMILYDCKAEIHNLKSTQRLVKDFISPAAHTVACHCGRSKIGFLSLSTFQISCNCLSLLDLTQSRRNFLVSSPCIQFVYSSSLVYGFSPLNIDKGENGANLLPGKLTQQLREQLYYLSSDSGSTVCQLCDLWYAT